VTRSDLPTADLGSLQGSSVAASRPGAAPRALPRRRHQLFHRLLRTFPTDAVLLRRLVLVAFDSLLILAAFYGALGLRLQGRETFSAAVSAAHAMPLLAVATGLPVLLFSGWYRGLTRYAGSYSLYGLLPRALLMMMLLLLANTLLGGAQPPRSFWVLYCLLFSCGAIGGRIVLRDLLVSQLDRRSFAAGQPQNSDATLIYGAGDSGTNLLNALRADHRFRIVGFLDDEPRLHGRSVLNLTIHNPSNLPRLVDRHQISKVLLALPSLSRTRKRLLVDQLTHLGLTVLSIPSLSELATGQGMVSDIKPVRIEDLLGREPSKPMPHLLEKSVRDKVVMVTGGGGSIGSELCRQVLACQARRLVIVDLSEYALYRIEKELSQLNCQLPIHAILGDCSDGLRMKQLCSRYAVQTIFHAAAYKHVPLVEANLCAGLANNLRATQAIIEAAGAPSVERLTLISTDKAVRPTNVMGASKRVCELLIQEAAERRTAEKPEAPIMAMVRFGNVLGSSGSVIPLFHEQISSGGPITVTHQAITRYFMTIPEAVQLVLQATGMAHGGELFLLDMGEPVRIAELARQMVELCGLRIRDENNPHGDIAIEYTGLRPGEKLFEELLISARVEKTDHPLIHRAKEPGRASGELQPLIATLHQALAAWDEQTTIEILGELVPEYSPEKAQHSSSQFGSTPAANGTLCPPHPAQVSTDSVS
jgi:FlaA1/EpsC-like NDP-sugar epimerase